MLKLPGTKLFDTKLQTRYSRQIQADARRPVGHCDIRPSQIIKNYIQAIPHYVYIYLVTTGFFTNMHLSVTRILNNVSNTYEVSTAF